MITPVGLAHDGRICYWSDMASAPTTFMVAGNCTKPMMEALSIFRPAGSLTLVWPATAWEILRGAQGAGDTLAPVYTPLPKTQARYLRLVGLGNSTSGWNSLTEVVIFCP